MGSGVFRANAPDLDVPAMERDLARIPAVSSARVVEQDGQVHEVHIVCGTGRSPKLIGRDVQSLLAARWGVDIDHRKVSVVQLEDGGAPVDLTDDEVSVMPSVEDAVADGVPRIVRVTIAVSGDAAEATVAVAAGDREVEAKARGVPSWVGQRRLAASAALEALGELDPLVGTCQLEEVTVLGSGTDSIVVTALTAWRDGIERTVAGAAPVGSGGELRAAAESVLRAFRRP